MKLYKVVDWNDHYENNRTRDRKSLGWVPMPNTQDGDGYTELLDHPNGTSHYGAACALILLASKCRPRGTLMRSGNRPHDPASISRITRIPADIIAEALPRLVNIGWFEACDIRQEGAGNRQDDAALRARAREGKKEEKERKKEKTPLPPTFEPEPEKPPKTKAGDKPPRGSSKIKGEKINGWKLWVDAWRSKWGENRPDPATIGKNTKAAKQVAQIIGSDTEVKRVFAAFLADTDPFIAKQGHSLSLILTRLDAYRQKILDGNAAARQDAKHGDALFEEAKRWEKEHYGKPAPSLAALLPVDSPEYMKLGYEVRKKKRVVVMGHSGKSLTLVPSATGSIMVETNGERRPFTNTEFLDGGYEPYHGKAPARESPKADAARMRKRRAKIQAQKALVQQEA